MLEMATCQPAVVLDALAAFEADTTNRLVCVLHHAECLRFTHDVLVYMSKAITSWHQTLGRLAREVLRVITCLHADVVCDLALRVAERHD